MKTVELVFGKRYATIGKAFLFLIAFAVVISSCSKDDVSDFTTEDTENIQANEIEELNNDDEDDLGVMAMESEDPSTGGKSASLDDRLSCAVVTRTGTDLAGSVRIDFGTGCTDPRGNVRKGAIIVDYAGRWFISGSSWTLRFEDYSRNNVAVSGTRTVANVTTDPEVLTFTVDVEDGVATFPDGSIARRRLHHRREHRRDENNILDRLIIYGTAEGNHRNGRGYYIEILEPLEYSRRCHQQEGVIIPVKGKKLIKHGERQLTVDYGDGRCDNVVTLINKNGRSKEYTVGQ